MFKKEVF